MIGCIADRRLFVFQSVFDLRTSQRTTGSQPHGFRAGTAIEVDGADHREAEQQSWDITKEEALRQVGLEVARVTGRQARAELALISRLVAVRARSRFEEPGPRSWRLVPRNDDNEVWLGEREQEAMWHESLGD